ncbi:MAG: hypothetical protein HY775_12760 [Acidobacteria bacterium]|nr:hypothetical protein [Acidobacteriota bacterium]
MARVGCRRIIPTSILPPSRSRRAPHLPAAVIALTLVLGLPASPAPAAEPSGVAENWELLSETADTLAQATTFDLKRGVLPGGTSAFDPEPAATFEVAGAVSGQAQAGWRVSLLDGAGSELSAVVFAPSDTAPTLKSSALLWPGADTPLDRIVAEPLGTLAGTLSLRKAYVGIHQQGTIQATVGRVPMATKQLAITSTSAADLADPVLYRHVSSDFHPAPEVRLRATARLTAGDAFEVRLVSTQGAVVGGSPISFQAISTASSSSVSRPPAYRSLESGPLTLAGGALYKVQVLVSGTGAQADLLSVDLVLSQRATDPKGLAETVGWFPGVSAPRDLQLDGQDLGFLLSAPITAAREGHRTWARTVKRVLGSGAADVLLRDRTAGVNRTTASASPGAAYTYSESGAADSPAGDVLDSRAVLGTATTARISSSALRIALVLGDIWAPVISGLAAVPSAFSPNSDGVKDSSTISANLTDESPAAWALDIKDAGGAVVGSFSGSGNSVQAIWDGRDSSGALVADGRYSAALTATDDWGNSATATIPVIVDTAGPTLTPESPAPDHNTTALRPDIAVRITDSLSAIDAATPQLSLDGAAVAASFNAATGLLSFTPASDLALGLHSALASAMDSAGNPASTSWRFNVASFSSTPGTASVDPIVVSFGPGTTQVTFASVPVKVTPSRFSLSSSMSTGAGTAVVRIPVDEARVAFWQAGVEVRVDPGVAPRSSSHEYAVLSPSRLPLEISLAGETLEVGPVTVQVPTAYQLTGGEVTLSLAATPVGVGLGSLDPLRDALDCATGGSCLVSGLVECTLDSGGAEVCMGTYPEVYLTVAGTRAFVVANVAGTGLDQLNGSPTTAGVPWREPSNPTRQYCGVDQQCQALLPAAHRTYWVAGEPYSGSGYLFRAFGHHRYYRISKSGSPAVIAAWQQSDVHPGQTACAADSSKHATASLEEFADTVEATRGWTRTGLRAVTAGHKDVELPSRFQGVWMRREDSGALVYEVGNPADLTEVTIAGSYAYPLQGDFEDGAGETYRSSIGPDGKPRVQRELAAEGAWNRWTPKSWNPWPARSLELMTGTEYRAKDAADDYAFRAGVYFMFVYENGACRIGG